MKMKYFFSVDWATGTNKKDKLKSSKNAHPTNHNIIQPITKVSLYSLWINNNQQ